MIIKIVNHFLKNAMKKFGKNEKNSSLFSETWPDLIAFV